MPMASVKCDYTNTQGQRLCSLPPWSRSEGSLCLLHDPSLQKPEEEVREILRSKMERGDFNFEGYVITISLNFREKIFSEFANFENCRFLGRETSFYRASFKKGALFNGSLFRGSKVNFSKVQWGGDFNLFNGVVFEAAEVNFLESVFSGKHIGFASARFTGQRLDFKGAEFQGTVFFTQTHFGADFTSFENAKFLGTLISFSRSHFEGK